MHSIADSDVACCQAHTLLVQLTTLAVLVQANSTLARCGEFNTTVNGDAAILARILAAKLNTDNR